MVSYRPDDPSGDGQRERPAGYERLEPGEHCRITEVQWFALLQSVETLHQWGSAFLVEEHAAIAGGCGQPLVRAYWRDDSAAHRHTAWRFDESTSSTVRETLADIDRAAARVADLLAQTAARGSSTLDEQRAEHAASEDYSALTESFYRDLLRLGAASDQD